MKEEKLSNQAQSSMPAPGSPSFSTSSSFTFITVDPSSTAESLSSRRKIRANAGRYIWQRRKASLSKTKRGGEKPHKKTNAGQSGTLGLSQELPQPPACNKEEEQTPYREYLGKFIRMQGFSEKPSRIKPRMKSHKRSGSEKPNGFGKEANLHRACSVPEISFSKFTPVNKPH